jgi:glycosyltransferase involved in cell wall biosynthesis
MNRRYVGPYNPKSVNPGESVGFFLVGQLHCRFLPWGNCSCGRALKGPGYGFLSRHSTRPDSYLVRTMALTLARPGSAPSELTDGADDAARVLHVVASNDGSTSSALRDYLASTGHLEHWVLAGKGSFSPLTLPRSVRSIRIIPLPDGPRARLRAISETFTKVRPSCVHAHSFEAGAYVRLARTIPTKSIVYSPHCYTFERRDISAGERALSVFFEYLLAPRAAAVAACSLRELHLAARLHRTGQIVHVPQVPSNSSLASMETPPVGQAGRIVAAIGSLCPQRDPEFFERTVAAAGHGASWIWIGDGEPRYRRLLEDAGVCVTGHLPRKNMIRLLRTAHVYVHTAAWEGSCDMLLEAAATGLPIAARSIPALRALRIAGLAQTPEALADTVTRLLRSPADRRIQHESFRRAFRVNTRATQSDRLCELYGHKKAE